MVSANRLCTGQNFSPVEWHNPERLQYQLTLAQMSGDVPRQRRVMTLIATAEGRYDFSAPGYLNALFILSCPLLPIYEPNQQ